MNLFRQKKVTLNDLLNNNSILGVKRNLEETKNASSPTPLNIKTNVCLILLILFNLDTKSITD